MLWPFDLQNGSWLGAALRLCLQLVPCYLEGGQAACLSLHQFSSSPHLRPTPHFEALECGSLWHPLSLKKTGTRVLTSRPWTSNGHYSRISGRQMDNSDPEAGHWWTNEEVIMLQFPRKGSYKLRPDALDHIEVEQKKLEAER